MNSILEIKVSKDNNKIKYSNYANKLNESDVNTIMNTIYFKL